MSASSNTEEKVTKILASKDDKPSASEDNQTESESRPGLLLSSGEINWDCPCLDGMASGPCGSEFKESFLCMYNSDDEQNNLNCLSSFKNLFSCMSEHPDYYRDKGFSDDLLNMDQDPKIESTEDEDDKKTESKE